MCPSESSIFRSTPSLYANKVILGVFSTGFLYSSCISVEIIAASLSDDNHLIVSDDDEQTGGSSPLLDPTHFVFLGCILPLEPKMCLYFHVFRNISLISTLQVWSSSFILRYLMQDLQPLYTVNHPFLLSLQHLLSSLYKGVLWCFSTVNYGSFDRLLQYISTKTPRIKSTIRQQ